MSDVDKETLAHLRSLRSIVDAAIHDSAVAQARLRQALRDACPYREGDVVYLAAAEHRRDLVGEVQIARIKSRFWRDDEVVYDVYVRTRNKTGEWSRRPPQYVPISRIERLVERAES